MFMFVVISTSFTASTRQLYGWGYSAAYVVAVSEHVHTTHMYFTSSIRCYRTQ